MLPVYARYLSLSHIYSHLLPFFSFQLQPNAHKQTKNKNTKLAAISGNLYLNGGGVGTVSSVPDQFGLHLHSNVLEYGQRRITVGHGSAILRRAGIGPYLLICVLFSLPFFFFLLYSSVRACG